MKFIEQNNMCKVVTLMLLNVYFIGSLYGHKTMSLNKLCIFLLLITMKYHLNYYNYFLSHLQNMLYKEAVKSFFKFSTSNIQNVSQKPFFKYFQNGVNLSLENKLEEANEEYKRSLAQITNNKEQQLEHFSFILRRIAHNHRRMGQMKLAQQKLYEIVKHKRQCGTNTATLYNDYDVLYRHMITYDLQKAIKLCKSLLLKQKDQMPISDIKLFNFNLANAYLLVGNYVDAKNRYSKCLQSDPQGKIKAYIYNNLGLACWWHKNPLQKVRDQQQITDISKIQKQFSQAKQLFAKSIQISEHQSKQLDDLSKTMLSETLNLKNGSLHRSLELHSQDSLYGAYNLSQFYIANDPLQKVEILYWLQMALNLSKKSKKQNFFNLIFIQNSLLSNDIDSLVKTLPNLAVKYREQQKFDEQALVCQVLGKILLQTDKQKAEQYQQRARLIKNILPSWTPKFRYLAIQPLNLQQ